MCWLKKQEAQTLNIDNTVPVYIIIIYDVMICCRTSDLCVLQCCEFKYVNISELLPMVFTGYEKTTVLLMLKVVTLKETEEAQTGWGLKKENFFSSRGTLLDSKLFNIQAAAVF